jgi:hypothetical protein
MQVPSFCGFGRHSDVTPAPAGMVLGADVDQPFTPQAYTPAALR